ncbi:L-asparagine permease 1 [Frondihabitans sp. 762G35]|uniref:amino acid permease n=1 Tax=Frondihabitans sp. 762G35 TaxID=1446794 RepID=UPI000D2061BA|nr:amino acid permease [Frondihabitans sp. 762G35]ARC57368.1 L-asparagine permease 1 [Frondihabitans sp. 762G35]
MTTSTKGGASAPDGNGAEETLPAQDFSHEQAGFQHGLKPRQLQMIAIGGAIGTGLFLGAGGRLNSAGPALAIVFAICGVFAFFILRALGELVLHRPSSGSFVSYAREFFGEKFAYAAGWMYFLNWAMTAIVDTTAVALYLQYWKAFTSAPQWLLALIALAVVLSVNLLAVKVFGELEFWFALVKVAALVLFLVIGVVWLAFAFPVTHDGQSIQTGLAVISQTGILPNGLLPAVIVVQGVVFAYAAIELVGTASGETQNPEKVVPRAINTVIIRIAVFYVGSLVLLSLLLPYTAYKAGQSPFVTFFSSIGNPQVGAVAGSIMNFVVLTAALSSLNAGLFSTGRVLHSMGMNGSAPKFTTVMSKGGVPYGGILLTSAITLLGVGLNAVVGASTAFEIVLNIASLGILTAWGTIVLCQMRLRTWAKQGKAKEPKFRLPGAPVTSWLTLAFLVAVLVLMAIDWPIGSITVASLVVIIPLLVLGWYLQRDRILQIAAIREGVTGPFPVNGRDSSKRPRGDR